MTLKECEQYILSKADSVKTVIAKWRYIRYTIYDSAFAMLEDSEKYGVVLTVFGKFPSYATKYPQAVGDAVNNEPAYFSSVLLSKCTTPDHVIKTMIDDSYRRRLRSIPLPLIADGRGDIPYCGIAPIFLLDSMAYDRESERKRTEDAVKNVSCTESIADHGIRKVTQVPEINMIGAGRWDNVPYAMVSNETYIKHLMKLMHMKQKAESEVCAGKEENSDAHTDA